MNQKDRIIRHLNAGHTLTILEAIGVFRIFNLKARINELRDSGYPVDTEMRKDATGKKYAVYSRGEAG